MGLSSIIADFSKDLELTDELRSQRRARIVEFESALMSIEGSIGDNQINEQVEHHFATGVYGREMFIPSGQLIVSKIHRGKTMNFIMQGVISVISEQGYHTYEAPYVFVSSPFTKRIVIAHTDVIWATAQGSHSTDLAELENELIAKDFTELNQIKGEVK
jgi:hypothetical protein